MNSLMRSIFSRISVLGVLFLVCAAFGLSPPANGATVPDEPLTLFRNFDTPDYYAIAKAARGTHLTGGTGVATLRIPGEPVAAYLYIAGHNYPELPGRHYPAGDEDVRVVVTHDPGRLTERRTRFTTVPVEHFGGTSYLNRLDISAAVGEGANRIAVSRYNLNGPEGFVAVAVYRSTQPDATLKTVQILDGADEGYYKNRPPWGPDSELVTFTFDPGIGDRQGTLLFVLGGSEPDRGDEIFLYTGSGDDPAAVLPDTDGDGMPDIVDRRHRLTRRDRRPRGNDPADRFGNLEAVEGAVSIEEDGLGRTTCTCVGDEIDLLSTPYTVPAGSGFAALQVQSENPEFGDSFTLYLAVNELPVSGINPHPEINVIKDANPTLLPEPGGEVLFTVTVENPLLAGAPQEDVNLESLTDDKFGDITSVHGPILGTTCTLPRLLQIGGHYTCEFRALVWGGQASPPHQDTVTAFGHGVESGDPVTDFDDAVVTFYGVFKLGAIGDFVWEDANRDGLQTGELGIGGVPVQLRDGVTGALLGTTVTDSQGIYNFANLPAGEYRVSVVPPPCMLRTWDLDGLGTPDTAAAALGASEVRLDVDFGYARPKPAIDLVKTVTPAEAYPGDIVTYSFQVTNTGESTLFNAVVTDRSLNPIPPYVVASIAELAPGGTATFQVGGFKVPTCSDSRTLSGPCTDGSTTCTQFPNFAGSAGVFPTCIPPALCHLTNTATVTAYSCIGPPVADSDDACLTILPLKAIGDLVWFDADGNGVRDAGEAGIANVLVTLRRPNGSTVTTRTGSTGAYSFGELRDGAYTVTPAAPAATPILTTPPSPRAIALEKCQLEDLTADFGFQAVPVP